MILADRRVVLGVSGGIACYKSCTIARRLTESGAAVDVVLTKAATEFVRPVTFEALTGRTVLTSLWERDAALSHIQFGQDTDLIVVAPATANVIAKAARGVADDLLTTTLLAASVPVLLAPAMNDDMFAHPATQENLERLRDRGWAIIGPAIGPLAEGPSDRPGRMSEPEDIVATAVRMVRARSGKLAGRTVLVTAGPTREEIDPVRVITNRSSGQMGFEVAAAAFSRGADVRLIAGPTSLTPPYGVEVVAVESTASLLEAVHNHLATTDVLVMAAAPADYKPREVSDHKLARQEGPEALALDPTPDILEATRDARKDGAIMVGFALETDDGSARARQKRERKDLDIIVLNHANEPGAGFEVDTNRVTLIGRNEENRLPLLSKRDVAERILDAVEDLL